jgi:ATP-binding cassette subfamily B protein
MEALGMSLIAVLAYSFNGQSGGIASVLPVLGALALGAQRLLPALQTIYSAWTSIAGSHASLDDTIELLEQPVLEKALQPGFVPLLLQRDIRFKDVSFRYADNGPWVLEGIDLAIPKGSRVGFVGNTGGGKSTALDLLMGLLLPTKGALLLDDQHLKGDRLRAWQRSIAHVPQSIYLADASIAENIAFGVAPQDIDLDRVKEAAQQAQIGDFIENCLEGYQATVGEQGIRLSGGQRQRLGIARALYKRASVLVFDEATSALDNATEQSVMEAIKGLSGDLTILLIAHRLSTIKHCDIVVELDQGHIVAQGTYDDLLEHSASFRKMAMQG